MKKLLYYILLSQIFYAKIFAQTDTINIMTYNVLNYGDVCQGANSKMRGYLKTIITYTQPDLFGMVKMQPIKRFPADFNGYLPIDFADSIAQYALSDAGNIKYSYCPFTNEARGADMNVLFYNKNKFGFIYNKVLTVNVTDFDLYKLFYKDPNLSVTNDTTFLFVVLMHTQSGNDATIRNAQLTTMYNNIKLRFKSMPNLIMMGDFNLRSSTENGYNQLVNATDTSFKLNDPPFAIDKTLTYPASWQGSSAFSQYFTTSTRIDLINPNSCGTDGGAKDWYDHILFSNWIVRGDNYLSYLPNSYQTIGNDGKRFGISANDITTNGANNSAPTDVINAIYQLSNKYPISAKIVMNSNTSGISPVDPENSTTALNEIGKLNDIEIITNPTIDNLQIKLSESVMNSDIFISVTDITGKEFLKTTMLTNSIIQNIGINQLPNGFYFVSFFLPEKKIYFTKKMIKTQ